MDYQPRQHRYTRQHRSNIADEIARLKQAPSRSGPNFDTENLSREQEYEIALSDCNYDPDQVQGYDEFKPDGLRYNPSRLYNLKVMDRQKGYRMLGVSVIGDTWTDPRTPAGRAMHAHHSNYLIQAGSTRQGDPRPSPYQPSQLRRYEQLAQQLGAEKIKQNAVATVEKCKRYREAINLKISDQCLSEAEKNKYLAKRGKIDAVIHELRKGLGMATEKEIPRANEIQEANALQAGLALLGFAIVTLFAANSESLILLGLIATLCFQLHETLDEVTDATIDDLLRDTGVERDPEKEPTPSKEPKPVPPTNGKKEEDCEVKPVGRHLGNDPIHDQCADYAPPNVFMGSDVLVVTPSGKRKHFDAMDASGALWEVKTIHFSKHPPFLQDKIIEKELIDIIADFSVAKECGRKYVFAVSDVEHFEALKDEIPKGVLLKLVDCL